MLFITNKQKYKNKAIVKVQQWWCLSHMEFSTFSSLKLYFLSKKFRLLSLTLRFWLLSITFLPG